MDDIHIWVATSVLKSNSSCTVIEVWKDIESAEDSFPEDACWTMVAEHFWLVSFPPSHKKIYVTRHLLRGSVENNAASPTAKLLEDVDLSECQKSIELIKSMIEDLESQIKIITNSAN